MTGLPIIQLDYNAAGVADESVLVLHVRNDPLDRIPRVNVGAGAFFARGEALLDYYTKFFITFWDWIHVQNKFIGQEQFVMTETCRRYISACHPHYPGRWRDWFALAEVVRNRTRLSEKSPHYLFLDEPPPYLPDVPEGRRISYCNGTVVFADDPKCRKNNQ